MVVEYIRGFTIPKRELTEEEKSRPVSFERYNHFMGLVGEDFLDNCDTCNAEIFTGWLLHKYPEYSKEILKVANSNGRYLEINSFVDDEDLPLYDEHSGQMSIYNDYAEFVNQTGVLKERDNQILIQIAEYYK